MNRIDRLFAIALLLQSKRVVTGAQIARHFEVSLRTVYRDLGALSEAGIPLRAEAGVGYSLAKGYLLPPVAFSENEAQALAIGAILVAKFGGTGTGDAAAAAQLKIQSILAPEAKERVARLGKQVTVFGDTAFPGTEHLVSCARAVAENRAIRLVYVASGQKRSARVIEPLGVVLYQNFWYLVAWCRLRRGVRSFRLDRVQELAVLPERFPIRRDFDLETHLRTAFADSETRSVRLWFSHEVAGRAVRELGPCLRTQQRARSGVEITALVWGCEWMSRWILSFGAQARVLGPEELVDAVRAQVAALAEAYAVQRSD